MILRMRHRMQNLTEQLRMAGNQGQGRVMEKVGFTLENPRKQQWPGPGSNRRHTDFQSVALPTELPGQSVF
jgi:hypothetical protein